MVPDYERAFREMDAELDNILREQYLLFRELHMTMSDQDRLTSQDRERLIEFLKEEWEAKAKAASGTQETKGLPDVSGR